MLLAGAATLNQESSSADIVEIKHIMLPPSPRQFKDIYVVFELMETDLHQVGCRFPLNGKELGLHAALLFLSADAPKGYASF